MDNIRSTFDNLKTSHTPPTADLASESPAESIFDRLAVWCLLLLVAVTPIFFIPSISFPFQFTKTIFAAVLILLSVVFYAVARMQQRSLMVIRDWLLHSVWLLPLVYVLSALVTGKAHALWGINLGVGTIGFMLLASLILYLTASVVRTKTTLLSVYVGFMVAFGLLALYQLIRLFTGPSVLTFGVFTNASSGPFGLLSELGMFFGLVTILSLVTLIGLRLYGWPKLSVVGTLVLSLFFLMVTNVQVVWWLVGITALGTLVYSLLQSKIYLKESSSQDSSGVVGIVSSLSVFVVALFFLFASSGLTSMIATAFNIGQIDIRPSWSTTIDIGRSVLAEQAFFGSGPGTFTEAWALHRPLVINQTVAWNTDFVSGIGFVPTSIVTTGLLGAIAWLVFFALFLWTGVKSLLLRPVEESFAFYLSLSSFVAALYLWVLAVIASPNAVLILMAFLLTGLFVASLRHQPGGLAEYEVEFVERPRIGFVTVLGLTLVIIMCVGSIMVIGERYAAASYFQQAVFAATVTGDLDKALSQTSKALGLHEQDRFYRLASSLDLAELNRIVATNQEPSEEVQQQFQARLARAIDSANRATNIGPSNYQNWLTLGEIYRSIVPLGIAGAYESAAQAYERAATLRPQSPLIVFNQAQLELANQNRAAGKSLLQQTLTLRPNYSDAIFLLAQVQVADGEIDEAIRSVQAGTQMAPNNPVAFFQLGLLRYSQEDYVGAARAMRTAVALNDQYANARYFLGLSEYWQGNAEAALEQFRRIEETNSDNQEVKSIIANMELRLNPFDGSELVLPPSTVEPDITQLDSLPIDEEDPEIGVSVSDVVEDEAFLDEAFDGTTEASTNESEEPQN